MHLLGGQPLLCDRSCVLLSAVCIIYSRDEVKLSASSSLFVSKFECLMDRLISKLLNDCNECFSSSHSFVFSSVCDCRLLAQLCLFSSLTFSALFPVEDG